MSLCKVEDSGLLLMADIKLKWPLQYLLHHTTTLRWRWQPSLVEELRKQLRRHMKQAGDAICGKWQLERVQATHLQSTAGVDQSDSSCKKLVTYIANNMATLRDFVQQMDRIILTCFSNDPKRVLRDVVTKDIWFHSRESEDEEMDSRDDGQSQSAGVNSSGTVEAVEGSTKHPDNATAIKLERTEVSSRVRSGVRGTSVVTDGAVGLEGWEVVGSSLVKRPRSRSSKKKLSTKKSLQSLVVSEPKAPRRRAMASSVGEDGGVETEADKNERSGQDSRRHRQKHSVQLNRKSHHQLRMQRGCSLSKKRLGDYVM